MWATLIRALSEKGKRGEGVEMEIKRGLPVRRSALHNRSRPDERNGVPLPGLPKIHRQRLCHAGSCDQRGAHYRGHTQNIQ
jgi:hypothetical protein